MVERVVQLRERHGIVTSQFESLRFLRDHPGARVADLASEFAAGVGAMSKGVDRWEKQGWIVRQPNPSDRRSSLLALTDAGMRLVEAAEQTFAEELTQLLGTTLTSSSLSTVAQALSQLRGALERDQVGLPAG
ncbi:MarR family transcriptional regulator [Nocardia sp. CA-128927]|uniref:MarR family transcriptional regulator n=1 Tax=Nocardia sp. CA-128927 TaxID=3239975 RepID=UPI003D9A0075